MLKKAAYFKPICSLLAALIMISCFAGSAMAYAAGSRMTESRISDWTYDAYHQIITYSYDANGKLIKQTSRSFSDDSFSKYWNESDTEFDYYDNGMERMRCGQGWEKHFDRYGTVIDSPKPAAPDVAFMVWYEESIQHYYDLEGNLIRLEADDTVYEYKYDAGGRILEVKSSEPFDYQLTFSYGKDGGYTLLGISSGWGNSYKEEYDRDGRILKSSRSGETTHEYSSDGRTEKVTHTWTDFEGKKTTTITEVRRSYDSNGQLQKEETWKITDYGDELQERKRFEYDGNGNMIHLQVFWYSGSFSPPSLVREVTNTYSS